MASLSRDYNRSARRGASEVIRGDVHLVLLLLPFSIGGLLLGGIPHLPVRLWRQRRLEKLALPAANPTRIRASATSSALKSMMAFGPHARPGRRGQAHQARGRAGGRAWQRARKRAKCARPASIDASAAGARPPVGSSAGRRSSRRSTCLRNACKVLWLALLSLRQVSADVHGLGPAARVGNQVGLAAARQSGPAAERRHIAADPAPQGPLSAGPQQWLPELGAGRAGGEVRAPGDPLRARAARAGAGGRAGAQRPVRRRAPAKLCAAIAQGCGSTSSACSSSQAYSSCCGSALSK